MRTSLLALAAALALAACGGVYSTHPASDEATTRFDDRLLGFWREDAGAKPGVAETRGRGEILAIGRAKAGEPGLRLAAVSLSKDHVLETLEGDLAPTTLAGRDHASVRLSPEKPAASWVVLRYEMDGADTMRVLGLDEAVVARDVRAGAVAGRVSESKERGEVTALTVTLEATTPALRAWLEKRGDEVWKRDRPLVLRRLRLD